MISRSVQVMSMAAANLHRCLGLCRHSGPVAKCATAGRRRGSSWIRIASTARVNRFRARSTSGVGKVTGDIQTQAEDTAEKVAGKAQNALGTAKDSLRDTVQD